MRPTTVVFESRVFMGRFFVRRCSMRQVISWCCLILFGIRPTLNLYAQEFEAPPVLSARALLPKDVVQSSYYTIEDRVENNGYLNRFVIRSKYGDTEAHGRQMLQRKLTELRAIDELEKLTSSKVMYEAAKKNGKEALLAPIRVASTAIDVATNPDKIVTTVKEVPDGVVRIFSWAARQVERGYDAASNYVSGSEESADGSSAPGASAKATDAAINAGLSYFKYNRVEREWLQRLGVDQFSDNELLRKEVQRVAGIETAVNIGFKFVPGFNLGLVGSATGWYKRAEKLGLYQPPEEIAEKNKGRLAELGVSGDLVDRFISHQSIVPSLQAIILDNLLQMKGVANRDRFVVLAAGVERIEGALFFTTTSEMLKNYHESRGAFSSIVTSLRIPGAVSRAGQVVIALPVDYLAWTKEMAIVFRDYRSVLEKEIAVRSIEVRIAGRASALAARELRKRKVQVFEGVN